MNSPLVPLRAFAAFTIALASLALSAAEVQPQPPASADSDPVFVSMHTSDPLRFERHRYGDATGEELIHSTLVRSAAAQAEFAHLDRKVVVLPEDGAAPAGSKELRLNWNDGAVTAEFYDGVSLKPKYLGVVSRTELGAHPNGQTMIHQVLRAGLRDARAEALIRAKVELNLYLGLQRVARELNKQTAKS